MVSSFLKYQSVRMLDRYVRLSEKLVLLAKDDIRQSYQSQARVQSKWACPGLYRSAGARVLFDGLRLANLFPSFAGL